MKLIVILCAVLGITNTTMGQTLQSTNSGGFVNNSLAYTVGEIYVLPLNPNATSSGLIGAFTTIEFSSLSLSEIVAHPSLKLYPNPTSHSVFLDTENKPVTEFFIYDLSGKLILRKKNNTNQLDVSELQQGTYLLLTDNVTIPSLKIIKQ